MSFTNHDIFIRTRGPKEADWWTDSPSKSVRIRYGKEGAAAEPAETVMELFDRIVKDYGMLMAMAVKRMGEWKTWTYQMYYDEARTLAKTFIYVRNLNLLIA